MQDLRFCAACGSGPFTNIQRHLNKCNKAKKNEANFMNSVHSIKQHGPVCKNEIQKWQQLPNLNPQAYTWDVSEHLDEQLDEQLDEWPGKQIQSDEVCSCKPS